MVRRRVFSTGSAIVLPSTLRSSAAITEFGSEHPEAFPGDPDGHPDEDWEVFYGQVQIEMLESAGEGFRVDQNMTYKLRLDPNDNLWKIVRWEDDALTGACGGAGKRLANAFSWAALKQKIAP